MCDINILHYSKKNYALKLSAPELLLFILLHIIVNKLLSDSTFKRLLVFSITRKCISFTYFYQYFKCFWKKLCLRIITSINILKIPCLQQLAIYKQLFYFFNFDL